jgi:hypothetical protein
VNGNDADAALVVAAVAGAKAYTPSRLSRGKWLVKQEMNL